MRDVFISHASEDKDTFVRDLARHLRDLGVDVWYDEFVLQPGDSLRRSIDSGLRESRYCVVVFSPSFFAKSWTKWELDGIVQRHIDSTTPVILPVWYDVGHAEIS